MSVAPKTEGALLFLYTESPLHVGAGRGLGAIDLPIQRERFSNLPVVPGSGLKGALREEARARGGSEELVKTLFGPEPPDGKEDNKDTNASDFAGAMSLIDARLLLLPVRSARGGWAWLTAPIALQRLARDMEILGQEVPDWTRIEPDEGSAWLATGTGLDLGKYLVLEDHQLGAEKRTEVDALAKWLEGALPPTPSYAPYKARLGRQLAVISDTEFTEMAEQATEINTRVRLDPQTRTVQPGALWTEESLPPESLLWSLALFSRSRNEKKGGSAAELKASCLEFLGQSGAKTSPLHRIRLGGDQGTGRGLVGVNFYTGSNTGEGA